MDAEAAFDCARCGKVAARVVVGPGGRPLPGRVRVLVEAQSFGGSLAGSSVEAALPGILAALAAHDAAALHAVDPEVARFWCPTCEASYCGACWLVWDETDPDDPDWFDAQRGRCPAGHDRLIVD